MIGGRNSAWESARFHKKLMEGEAEDRGVVGSNPTVPILKNFFS